LVCAGRFELVGTPDLVAMAMLGGASGITALNVHDPYLIAIHRLGDTAVSRIGSVTGEHHDLILCQSHP
jgi:hypothetical protein